MQIKQKSESEKMYTSTLVHIHGTVDLDLWTSKPIFHQPILQVSDTNVLC